MHCRLVAGLHRHWTWPNHLEVRRQCGDGGEVAQHDGHGSAPNDDHGDGVDSGQLHS